MQRRYDKSERSRGIRLPGTPAILAVLLFLSLTACAAQPEQAAQGRGDVAQLIETAGEQALYGRIAWQTAAPERYSEEFTGDSDRIAVSVDADVTVPEVKSARIVRVTGQTLTQSEIDDWRRKLLGDGPVYDAALRCDMAPGKLEALWQSVRNPVLWQGTVREQIVGYVISREPDGETAVRTEPNDDQRAAVFYETRLPEPDKARLRETDGQLRDDSAEENSILLTSEDGQAFLRAANVNGLGQLCYLRRGDLSSCYGSAYWRRAVDLYDRDFYLWVQSAALEITQEQAEQLAGDFLADMEMDGGWSVISGETVLSLPRTVDAEGNYLGSVYRCWKLDYTRMVDGIPVLPAPDRAGERLTLFVTDDGVAEFYYDLPWTEGETLAEQCRLLPFEEVMAVFRTMMPVLYRFTPDEDTSLVGVCRWDTVTDIRFGYTPIPEDGGGTHFLLVPSWTFVGTEEYDKVTRDGYILEGSQPETVFMVINAVDGSVIYPG